MQHVQNFINYLKYEKRYSPLTVRAYQKDLEQFFLFTAKHTAVHEVDQIKFHNIRNWIVELKEIGDGNNTINRKISTLKSFFKYLFKNELIKDIPTEKITAPKKTKRLPVFVNEKVIQQIIAPQLQKEGFPNEHDFTKINEKIIIELLYATGMRRAELVNLKTSQIEFDNKLLRILGKGNKERLVPIVDDLLLLLKQYIEVKNNIPDVDNQHFLVLPSGKKVYEKYVYQVVKRILAVNTSLEKNSPHVLRHTFATHLLNNGAEINAIKELLGHASLAATQVYTHNTIEKLKEVYKKAHPRGNSKD